jgi:hypothetical protein
VYQNNCTGKHVWLSSLISSLPSGDHINTHFEGIAYDGDSMMARLRFGPGAAAHRKHDRNRDSHQPQRRHAQVHLRPSVHDAYSLRRRYLLCPKLRDFVCTDIVVVCFQPWKVLITAWRIAQGKDSNPSRTSPFDQCFLIIVTTACAYQSLVLTHCRASHQHQQHHHLHHSRPLYT